MRCTLNFWRRGVPASETDCITDQEQVSGEIASSDGASLDIGQASLEILMDSNRHVNAPGTAPRPYDHTWIDVETVPRSAKAAAATHKIPNGYPVDSRPDAGQKAAPAPYPTGNSGAKGIHVGHG